MDKFEEISSKPHLNGPTQQHYVPSFYLKGFTSGDVLTVFDRINGEIRHRQKPQNVATVRHLYTFEDNQDRKRFDWEVLFGHVESAATPVLKSLANGEPLSQEAREAFAIFLGLAAVRTPAALAETSMVYTELIKARTRVAGSDEDRVFEFLRRMKGSDGNEAVLRGEARDVAALAREGAFDLKLNDDFVLHRSLNLWALVSEALVKRDWMLLHATGNDQSFLTSDSPIVLMSRSSELRDQPIGYGSPHAQILFPLTSKCALVASGSLGRTGRCDIAVDALHRFNRAIAQDCWRFVVGGDADLVQRVTSDLGLAGTEWQPKSRVEVMFDTGEDGALSESGVVRRMGF
ncbi:MAG: DUF4238 domain-containing protein [Pseudomonas sp.]|uniref:DUF4238 domain-containing protein n=1 Tax=Pseudomonas sp. TaxID=306 RepID=UPI0025CCC27C|nr:DUF4238 domain-containing protein [Pseudomonas sp.]MBW8352562.1 DUF4238 domain-containing protein [Pseudomonas sp.]